MFFEEGWKPGTTHCIMLMVNEIRPAHRRDEHIQYSLFSAVCLNQLGICD